jgi:DNA-binding CsgD family transcriptional regulator
MDGEFPDVLGLIYDSILDEARWAEALAATAQFAGGFGAFHVIANPVAGVITHSESVDVDPQVNELYLKHFAGRDLRLAPALAVQPGKVMTEGTLLDAEAFRASELFNDLLEPYDIPHVMFMWLRRRPEAFQTIAIEGSKDRGPFSAQEMARYQQVVPHLMRAARLREMLAEARHAKAAHFAVLNGLPFGIVMLDHAGRIVETTFNAEALLREGDGVLQKAARLRAASREPDRKLQRAIGEALAAHRAHAGYGESLAIARSGRSTLNIRLFAIRSDDRLSLAAQPAVLVVLADPDRTPMAPAALIQKSLGLTTAETALAQTLLVSASLREAARLLHRSVNTCKAQLKSIYAKTACRSHAQLARKLVLVTLAQGLDMYRSSV